VCKSGPEQGLLYGLVQGLTCIVMWLLMYLEVILNKRTSSQSCARDKICSPVQELPRCVKVILDKENGTMNKQQQHELVQKAQLAGMGFTVFIRSTITSTEQRPSQQCRHTMPCANKVFFFDAIGTASCCSCAAP
jgi:hypothetical protein